MVDAGLPGDSIRILEFLEEQQLKPTQIEYLVLTHAHPDHAGNAAFFQRAYGVKVIVGLGETAIIANSGYDQNLCPRGILGRFFNKTIASQRYETFHPDLLVEQHLDLQQFGWPGFLEVYQSHTPGFLGPLLSGICFRWRLGKR